MGNQSCCANSTLGRSTNFGLTFPDVQLGAIADDYRVADLKPADYFDLVCCSDPYFDFPFFQSTILRQDHNGRTITNRQCLQRHR
jgi:hypothetical protein